MKKFYINMENDEILTHAQFIEYAQNFIDSKEWEDGSRPSIDEVMLNLDNILLLTAEELWEIFVGTEAPMDTKTRCIIEAVVLELLNQGLKNFPCGWQNISTCTDDELLNFIKTYYD